MSIAVIKRLVEVDRFVYNGIEYDTLEAAELAQFRDHRYALFMQDYRDRAPRLPKDYTGLFVIKDEGPIDIGGRSIVIEYVKGTLEAAIRHACSLDEFWGYGAGYIEEIQYTELD